MGRQEEVLKERLKKIEELRKQGINPYVSSCKVENHSKELQEKYKKLKNEEQTKDSVVIAGRLMSFRDMGKIAFGTVNDGQGQIQVLIQEGETPDKTMEFVKKYIDIGDFIGVKGRILRTKRGELSILVKNIDLLTKSILSLPDKWHGIQNDEDRLRRRYLDIIMDQKIRERFIRKSKFWQTIRDFLLEREFLEVETPILENTPGGAEARPFITHHNALNSEVYLRISPELWLKRLMVAGYPKVFEIGRIFRNEGMDAEHLQDYTQMEFYWGYADYNDGMKLVEEMYKKIAKEVYGTMKFKIKEFEVDFDKPWEMYDYTSTIKKMTKIDLTKATLSEIETRLKELGVEYDKNGFNLNRGIDSLWKHCRKNIAGPGFLINVPVMMEPLAKRMEKNPELVERFQVILAGSELGKGFSELNDPIDQLGRFNDQEKLRAQGDEEAQMKDDEFVEALKYGMPPTCGFGVSERLFSFLEGQPIREAVIFPLMKPQGHTEEQTSKSQTSQTAVAVVNTGADLLPWQQMNTIAHLTAALGARKGKQLLFQEHISTKDHQKVSLNIQHAIMIKQASSSKELTALAKTARDEGLEVTEFTREMIETTDDRKVIEQTANKSLKDIEFLGVLIFGKRSHVEELTSKFSLFADFSQPLSKKEKKGGKS